MPELLEQRLELEKMAERFSSGVFEREDYVHFAKLSVALLVKLLDKQQQEQVLEHTHATPTQELETPKQLIKPEQKPNAHNLERQDEDVLPTQADTTTPINTLVEQQEPTHKDTTTQADTLVAQHISRQKAEQQLDFEQLEQKIKSHVLPQMQAIINAHFNQAQAEMETKLDQFVVSNLDLNSVFRLERKMTQVAFRLALLGGFVVIALSLAIVFMMPLVRVEPLLIDFANADKHFAIIQRADAKMEQNEALMRSLVGSYILNRETINHIDDQERYESVRLQSTSAVFKTFESLVATEHSIYTNENLDREVKIINISIYKRGKAQNIAVSDVVVKLFNQGYLSYEKRYRITLSFKFLKNLKFDYNSMPKNPTGFEVLKYSITEIATIKALDTTHRIHKLPRSKIIYQDKGHKGEGQ